MQRCVVAIGPWRSLPGWKPTTSAMKTWCGWLTKQQRKFMRGQTHDRLNRRSNDETLAKFFDRLYDLFEQVRNLQGQWHRVMICLKEPMPASWPSVVRLACV